VHSIQPIREQLGRSNSKQFSSNSNLDQFISNVYYTNTFKTIRPPTVVFVYT